MTVRRGRNKSQVRPWSDGSTCTCWDQPLAARPFVGVYKEAVQHARRLISRNSEVLPLSQEQRRKSQAAGQGGQASGCIGLGFGMHLQQTR